MKPTYYGCCPNKEGFKTELMPTQEINIPRLEKALEKFLIDTTRILSADKITHYTDCVDAYRTLFKHGCIPIEQLDDFSPVTLEIAKECVDEEMDEYIKGPATTSGINYFYEYCRSLAVAEQVSALNEFLDEESDFI